MFWPSWWGLRVGSLSITEQEGRRFWLQWVSAGAQLDLCSRLLCVTWCPAEQGMKYLISGGVTKVGYLQQELWDRVKVVWEGWRKRWLGKGNLLASSRGFVGLGHAVSAVPAGMCVQGEPWVLCLQGRCWQRGGEQWGAMGGGCSCVPASGLEKGREHSAELPATPNQPVIVSIMKINWPLLPKINVSVPNPHFNSTSSLEMHIIWLQSHIF